MPNYDVIEKRVHEFFDKNGREKPTAYAFGVFDVLALLREIQEEEKMK